MIFIEDTSNCFLKMKSNFMAIEDLGGGATAEFSKNFFGPDIDAKQSRSPADYLIKNNQSLAVVAILSNKIEESGDS